MFNSQESILVVCEERNNPLGRKLVHAISSYEQANASLYTPAQYSDNEHQIAGDQKIIFIGENDVSDDFIPLIDKEWSELGASWGMNENKVVIWVEESGVERGQVLDTYEKLKEQADYVAEVSDEGFLSRWARKLFSSSEEEQQEPDTTELAESEEDGTVQTMIKRAGLDNILPKVRESVDVAKGMLEVSSVVEKLHENYLSNTSQYQLTIGTTTFLLEGIDEFVEQDEDAPSQ